MADCDGTSRADAELDHSVGAGSCYEVCDVSYQLVLDGYLQNGFLHCRDGVSVDDLSYRCVRVFRLSPLDDVDLAVSVRITDRESDEETIHLRVREDLCAGGADLVLCRDYDERIRQLVCFAVNCDLLLFHCFEERRLRSAGCTVDLVCEEQIGVVDDSRNIYEIFFVFIKYGKTDDVGWQYVRCELDSVVVHSQSFAQSNCEGCLSYARYVIEQNVSVREYTHQNFAYDIALADDNLADLIINILCRLIDGFDCFLLHFTCLLWLILQLSQS